MRFGLCTVALGALLAAACQPTRPAPLTSAPAGATAPVWSRHELGAGGPQLGSVIVGGSGLLAAGQTAQGGGIWSSVDGLTWTAVVAPVTGRQITALAAGPGGFLAVGSEPTGDERQALVLRSTDGADWAPVAGPPEGAFDLSGVAASRDRWVAIGSGSSASIWLSEDGATWRAVTTPEDAGRLTAVAAGGPGFVVVGERGSNVSGVPAAVVLISADGATWTGLADAAAFGATSLQAVAATADQVLVGGVELHPTTGAATPAIWASPDGGRWTRATVDDPRASSGGTDGQPDFFEGALVTRFVRTDGGWLAVGTGTDSRVDTMAQDLAIWQSADGRAFRRLDHALRFEAGVDPGFKYGPTGAAAWDGKLAISGIVTGPQGAVWLSPPRDGGTEPSARPSLAPPSEGSPEPRAATPAPMASG